MRVFYLFPMKDEFKSLYQDNPYHLFRTFNQLYHLQDQDLSYKKTVFRQLLVPIDKQKLDNDLFIKFHQSMAYSKRGNIHYMNNLYKNEVSRLTIKKHFMKLEVDSGNSTFFELLESFHLNLFVCDFHYLDYFWLDQAKSLV